MSLFQLSSSSLIAVASSGDENILEIFGINLPGVLAQFITVTVVFLVLKKYAFGPITEVLADRRDRIRQADERAAEIEKQLAETEKNVAQTLQEANAKADQLILEAKETAEQAGEKVRNQASLEAGELIEKARQAAAQEKDQLVAEVKREFGKLVVDTTAAVTGKVLSDEDQTRLNKEASAALQ